jgi:hypothetical protein
MYGASRPSISSGGTSQTKDEYHVLGTNGWSLLEGNSNLARDPMDTTEKSFAHPLAQARHIIQVNSTEVTGSGKVKMN